MGSCPICEADRPLDVLAEVAATWVTAATEAPLPGYVCVVSKVHVMEPFALRGMARHAFWDDVSAVAEAVKRVTGSPKLNYEVHGNTIPHLHLHLYPRYPGDPYEGAAIDPRAGHTFARSAEDLARLRDAILSASHAPAVGRSGRTRDGIVD